jgi:hypothetical protein
MYPLHLWHVVEDVRRARLHEARARTARRRALRQARARRRAVEPGALRQVVGFGLVEAGLRLLTPRPAAQVRRAR